MIDLKPYLGFTKMMIIATIDELGYPYTSNVYFKFDDKYRFYFKSKIYREHSKHIISNGKVAWSVINTEKYSSEDKDKKGLQFQGSARLLKGSEADKLEESVYGRKKSYTEMQESVHYIFECNPEKVKIWDEDIYSGEGKVFEF